MKARISTYLLVFCSAILHAQDIDSVSAILIKYDVELDIKESLAALAGEPNLKEFFYVVKDDVVFIKEVHEDASDDGSFRCFDTNNKMVYECVLDEDRIIVNSQAAFPYQNLLAQPAYGKLTRHQFPDSIQIIEGYPCKPGNVYIDGIVHQVWYTDVFGTQFSTIADLPGIPLYYEKSNPVDGKLKFRAVDVRPIVVPAYYFDIANYEIYTGEAQLGKREYLKPLQHESFSRKLMDGSRVSTGDSLGQVMFFTFWRPEQNNLHVDINTLNTLQREFEGEDILFVALNPLSPKKGFYLVEDSGFEFPQIANADYIFNQYRIGAEPTHIIVDKRGYLRYRYSGVFGKPLLKSMKTDLESLLNTRASINQ